MMRYEYSDKPVTAWGGMNEMKSLLDKSGVLDKLLDLNLPSGEE